jgi:hypothetical protein
MRIRFEKWEIETILDWFDYATSGKYHFGGPDLEVPAEMQLAIRLRNSSDGYEADDDDMRMIADWMDMTISRTHGSAKYLFGFEQLVYFKIIDALKKK